MDIKLSCNHLSYLSERYVMEFQQKRCEECGGRVSGDAFTCMRCCVWLHASCVDKMLHVLPQQIMHPLHLHHQLQLDSNNFDFICDRCMYISVGYRYRCSSCNFNLDLACASSVNDELPKDQGRPRFKDGKKMTILHYSHGHSLSIFKYRKIGKEDDYCLWCEKRLSDSEVCCGCTDCEFYLHSACRDKIPRRLSHPFHPGHPLRLSYIPEYCSACGMIIPAFSPCYMCEMCDFRLDCFRCAQLLPTQKLGCHDHLLTYFNFLGKGHEGQNFYCKACDKPCGGAGVYRCMQCHFSFHLRCVVPSSAEHRYHRHPLLLVEWIKEDDSEEYYCDICEKERNPNHPVYFCQSCTFIAHIDCVLDEDKVSSSSARSMENKALVVKEIEHKEETNAIRTLMQPIFHSHQMYEVTEEFKGNRFCYCCRLLLDGPSYICKTCHEFYLHEKCAKLPYEIQHPFHSAHPLNLYTSYRPGIGRLITCDECKVICLGFIYFCELCNFKLDVKCASLITHNTRVSPEKEIERVTELQYRFHPHRLVLGYCHDPINEIKCTICELPILGPAYFCPDRLCNYILHESCLTLPQVIQVPFHPEHMLAFRLFHIQSNPQCYACPLNLKSFTFAYNCEHCHLNLHPVCANSLKRPLKCESHLDDLYYFGPDYQLLCANYDPSWATLFICDECEKSCQGEAFYRCIQCQVNFHLSCIPIPEIANSKYHIHPLVLKDSFVEDDSGKYYCDFCEEERNPKDHVYYCQECDVKTIAHIECVLAEVEDNMVESRKNRPQRSLQKKRHEGLQAQPMPAALHSAIDRKLENFPAMVAGIWTDDRNLQLEAATQFKKLLSDRNPPNDEVIRAGVIPRFVELLTKDDFPQLQYEVALALNNIASGASENRKVLIDHGVVPIFVKLLGSPSDDIREHAAWGLGNIAFNCHTSRDLVLSHGALLPLLALLNEQANFSLVPQASWTLSNLCTGRPAPPFDQVKPALPTLARLIHSDDEEVLVNACRALYYLSAGTDDQTRAVIEAGVCGRLVELLFHPSPFVLTEALGTIANFFSVDDMQTQAIFEANTIVCVVDLLQNDDIDVKREAARAIKNATRHGTRDQIKFLVSQGCIKSLCDLLICPDPETVADCLTAIANFFIVDDMQTQAIFEANTIVCVIDLLQNDDIDVKREAARVIRNATWRRTRDQIKFLVSQGCIKSLCDLLICPDPETVADCLTAIANFFIVDDMQTQAIFEANTIVCVIDLLQNDDIDVKREAARVIRNATWRRTRDQIKFLVSQGCIKPLCDLLICPDPVTVANCLGAIANFFIVNDMQTQAIFEANTIVRVIDLLQNDDIDVKREAARAIQNATWRGTRDQIKFLVSQGCIKSLCDLLICPDPGTVTHCLAVIANFFSVDDMQTQVIFEANTIVRVVDLLQNDDIDVKREAARAIRNATMHGTHDQIKFLVSQGCIKPLCDLLICPDPGTVTHCLAAIANFFSVDDMQTQAIFEANTIVRVIDLLQNDDIDVKREAARVIRNATWRGTRDQIKFLVSQGCIKPLCDLLICPDPGTVTHCLAAIANFFSVDDMQTQAIFEANTIVRVVDLLKNDDIDVKREAARVIINATCGTRDQIKFLVSQGCIKPLCDLLTCPDLDTVIHSLAAIANILWAGEADKTMSTTGGTNLHMQMIEEAEGREKIENLRSHDNTEFFEMAVKIVEAYWGE